MPEGTRLGLTAASFTITSRTMTTKFKFTFRLVEAVGVVRTV